jgi:hypothetical protein
LARVLRPGGRLVAITNGRDHLAELWHAVEHEGFETGFSGENGGAQLEPLCSRGAARRSDLGRVPRSGRSGRVSGDARSGTRRSRKPPTRFQRTVRRSRGTSGFRRRQVAPWSRQ